MPDGYSALGGKIFFFARFNCIPADAGMEELGGDKKPIGFRRLRRPIGRFPPFRPIVFKQYFIDKN